MTIPEGLEQYYPNKKTWLRIMKPIYGLKQARLYYYRNSKREMQTNGFEQSNAYPCIFFKWRHEGIVIQVTWKDNNLVIAPSSCVEPEKDMMKCHFECDDIGVLSECIGC